MPGYTHLQRAQPVYLGQLLAYFWMLARGRSRFSFAEARAGSLPLGAGALAVGSRSITANRGFCEAMGKLEDVVLEEVASGARGVSEEQEDIFSMLERNYAQSGQPASEEKMRDELVTMILRRPTATSLAWVFKRFLRHPTKLTRLREEILRDEGDEYLDATVKETLRLCLAVPLVVAPADRADGARWLPAARRHDHRPLHLPHAPSGRHLPQTARVPP